jgi:hypothetical protein
MKTQEQKLADIRAACIKANSEIQDWCKKHDGKTDGCFSCGMSSRPIRLADVLLAIPQIESPIETQLTHRIQVVLRWNLRKDRLEDQSPETLDFIHSLLV